MIKLRRHSMLLAMMTVVVLACATVPLSTLAGGWETKSPMPTPREKIASCAIGNHIYVIGGAGIEANPGLNINEGYNTTNDTWTRRRTMPTARLSATAAAIGGLCFVIGGQPTTVGPLLALVEAYDPTTNQWTTRSDMPTARFLSASAVIDGIIYVVGGAIGVSTLGTLEAYDPATDTWNSLRPMPDALAAVAATALGGKLYVMGGTNNPNTHRSEAVWIYDPATDSWSSAADLPVPMAGTTATTVDGHIYAIAGGALAGTVADVNIYNPASDTWTGTEPINVARNRHVSQLVNGHLFVIGGAEIVHPAPHPGIDSVEAMAVTGEPFTINSGHSGAWFNPETSGQGQFIDVVPEDQFMFISWFTFTDAASDNSNEQQWYTAQGKYSGDTAVLVLFETFGGKFDDPQEATTTQVGEVTLTFSDCDTGMMSYSFDEEELRGEFPLIRVIGGSGNVCERLSGNNTEAVDINAGMDGAWFDPDTSGQGYFIDAHPDPEGGNFIFVSWFTYGNATASGQRWLTAQGSFERSMAEIDVFETTGGSFDDPEPVSTTKVGTMSLDFTDCSNAQLSYSLPADPAEGDIAITRVIPGSQALCEELAGDD